jgi:hypothetical protein
MLSAKINFESLTIKLEKNKIQFDKSVFLSVLPPLPPTSRPCRRIPFLLDFSRNFLLWSLPGGRGGPGGVAG